MFDLRDQVKETMQYRYFVKDREIRGRVQDIKNDVVIVVDKHGWTYHIHQSWLELDTYQSPELKPSPNNIWSKPYAQNYCQHCGEKL